jgi:uncharacterized RDD family membrane protein YckC
MKCPKCGYLAFETGDRCRNCGYEFSLNESTASPLDMTLDREFQEPRRPLDLDRIIGAPEPDDAGDLPLFTPPSTDTKPSGMRRHHNAGRRITVVEDEPLISVPSRPRAPLGVRRATPEVPRARARTATTPGTAAGDLLFEQPRVSAQSHVLPEEDAAESTAGETPAAPLRRILAALVDVMLLSLLDAVVVYFTLRLSGLTIAEIAGLPLLPLAAFFLLLNGSYFIAFTTVGGQSIGKMALGIKVIGQEAEAVPLGRATLRTVGYFASALPFGAGFLPGIVSADRLALHDRLAHTRVVRPTHP